MATYNIRTTIKNADLSAMEDTLNYFVNNYGAVIISAYSEPDLSIHVILAATTVSDLVAKITALQTHFASNFTFVFDYS